MAKFDGVLFYTDYDDTLYNSAHTVSLENRAAIRYFVENGGRFSVATGRAWRTFTPQIGLERLELSAPAVLSNGAAIYDYAENRYLMQTFLDAAAPARFVELCASFPLLAVEAYHGDDIYVYNPNAVTTAHLLKVRGRQTPCAAIPDMPTPWTKVIMEQEEPYLKQVQAHLLARWGGCYEAIFSNPRLLEVTDKGSHKGAAVARAASLLGVAPQNLYCMGDGQNDIPMLALSAVPFAPANCAPAVRAWMDARGAPLLPRCDEHAVARAIEILDKRY